MKFASLLRFAVDLNVFREVNTGDVMILQGDVDHIAETLFGSPLKRNDQTKVLELIDSVQNVIFLVKYYQKL